MEYERQPKRAAERTKTYPYAGTAPALDPDYDRVVRSLSDADLEDELLTGKGEPGYRAALIAEAERRGSTPPMPS